MSSLLFQFQFHASCLLLFWCLNLLILIFVTLKLKLHPVQMQHIPTSSFSLPAPVCHRPLGKSHSPEQYVMVSRKSAAANNIRFRSPGSVVLNVGCSQTGPTPQYFDLCLPPSQKHLFSAKGVWNLKFYSWCWSVFLSWIGKCGTFGWKDKHISVTRTVEPVDIPTDFWMLWLWLS